MYYNFRNGIALNIPLKFNNMKNFSVILILFFTLMLLSSCVTTQMVTLQDNNIHKNVKVYFTKLPDCAYEEIAYLDASGSVFHGPESLLKNLVKKADRIQADAIIQVRFYYIPWVLMSIPSASAIAIRFKE